MFDKHDVLLLFVIIMKLATIKIMGIPLWESRGIRTQFNAASADDMRALGRAFAPVAGYLQQQDRGRGRIGLKAPPGVGKSTFIKGMLEPFGNMQVIERACDCRDQFVWRRENGAYIRHYDTRVPDYAALQSYWQNQIKELEGPCLDIVEHASQDRHDKRYDCLIEIKPARYLHKAEPEYYFLKDIVDRKVTVSATSEIFQSAAFAEFLQAAAPLRVESNDNQKGQQTALRAQGGRRHNF